MQSGGVKNVQHPDEFLVGAQACSPREARGRLWPPCLLCFYGHLRSGQEEPPTTPSKPAVVDEGLVTLGPSRWPTTSMTVSLLLHLCAQIFPVVDTRGTQSLFLKRERTPKVKKMRSMDIGVFLTLGKFLSKVCVPCYDITVNV